MFERLFFSFILMLSPFSLNEKAVYIATSQDFKSTEALDEVNATRAKKKLKPFIKDDGLTQGAINISAYRAEHLIAGHTHNDFKFLPKGVTAKAAGCAAWPEKEGWGACCTYENYTYAGAAWAKGKDGRRYMHLFVK